MNHGRYTKEEIVSLGEVIYEESLRSIVETEENIGKIIMIDIESRDYAIAASGLKASEEIRKRHPEGVFCALRIGYSAVETIGGVLSRREKAA
jgi:hypothetical protein